MHGTYSKGEGSKVIGTRSLEMTKGGPSGDSRGGSSRSYPKGSKVNTGNPDFNPQKTPPSDKYVGGV